MISSGVNTQTVARLSNKSPAGIEDYVETTEHDLSLKQAILSAALCGYKPPAVVKVTPEVLDYYEETHQDTPPPSPKLLTPEEERPLSPLKNFTPLSELPSWLRQAFRKHEQELVCVEFMLLPTNNNGQ